MVEWGSFLPVSELCRVVVVGQGQAQGGGQLVGPLVDVQQPQLGDVATRILLVRVSFRHLV